MGRSQDTSGDYGYDMAHEAVGRPATPADATGGAEPERYPVDGNDAQGEDLGYDEAHDF